MDNYNNIEYLNQRNFLFLLLTEKISFSKAYQNKNDKQKDRYITIHSISLLPTPHKKSKIISPFHNIILSIQW